MLLLKNDSTDPYYNLAFEEYCARMATEPGESLLFFWRNRPSVIVGRFQNTFAEINAAVARRKHIEVVRRITGGGAVYHDLNNLNYSFILPSSSDAYLKQAKNSGGFEELFDIILELLEHLGVKAEKSGRNDLLLGGKKISGAARQLTRHSLLLHGTLLFDVDMEALSSVLNADPAKYRSKGLQSIRSRVTNLKEHLPPGMNIASFKAALENGVSCPVHALSESDLGEIEMLAQSKYRDWNWTWGKSPAFTLQKKRRFGWGNLELLLEAENGLIKNCGIYGDFFTGALYKNGTAEAFGVEDVAEALRGLRVCSPELRAVLELLPLGEIFAGADKTELIEFFME